MLVGIDHTYRGDLRVTLISPRGIQVVLHDRAGGGQDNLRETYDVTTTPGLANLLGRSVGGDWTLRVQDLAPIDQGRLSHWALEIGTTETSILEVTEAPGTRIPQFDPIGIESEIQLAGEGTIGDVSVELDITHTFIRDLIVTLVAPNQSEVVLHNRSGGSSDNIIRSYAPSDTPELATLLGSPFAGTWRLRIGDHEDQDSGKLNSWTLRVGRA